jgi:hypothetical protein
VSRWEADGSLTLDPAEVAVLRRHIQRWHEACDQPGADTSTPIVDLAIDVRVMLRIDPDEPPA